MISAILLWVAVFGMFREIFAAADQEEQRANVALHTIFILDTRTVIP